ncbi:MAG TPA: peptidylprolyl isomerase [Thermoanaerobaculia bacterium]|nr:peptidylprolyl isomerase [Thermoanaerobaculia bacterium]
MENPSVALDTNHGRIVLELYADKAPKTVENFLAYVSAGFFDGTLFHRVIPNFMIQGGGFDAQQRQKTTRSAIQNEADNGLTNGRGTIAMARTGDPHSATAQFFINLKDNGFLNHSGKNPQGWGYTVFGKVTEGMDAVDRIAKVRTAPGKISEAVPAEAVVIEKATVVPAA